MRNDSNSFLWKEQARKRAAWGARNLIGQGVEGVTIKDENGRVYVPAEFDTFLNGE
jgi:hypothetical protein